MPPSEKAVHGAKCVAMEYSPDNAIPYVAKVDAGTVELIRSFGPTVVSSARYWCNLRSALDGRTACKISLRRATSSGKRWMRLSDFLASSCGQENGFPEYDGTAGDGALFHGSRSDISAMLPNCSVNGNGANLTMSRQKKFF